MVKLSKVVVFTFIALTGMIIGPAMSANLVDIDVVKSGESESVDILYTGVDYEFRIRFENDATLNTICNGFRIWSMGGATWDWLDMGGYGMSGCVTVRPGCRLDPPWDVFIFTGLIVEEHSWNEVSPDTILFGGSTMPGINGITPGPLEHMISIHFRPTAPGIICIDSTLVPPSNVFIWQDYGVFTPGVTWSPGGLGWAVMDPYVCGDVNEDDLVNILDIVHLINFKYKDGADPACPWE